MMKRGPVLLLVLLLFAGSASLSYAQDGTLTFFGPWNLSSPGSENVFFGQGGDDSSDRDNVFGVLSFEGFPSNSDNVFGFGGFFDSFLDQPFALEAELLSPLNVSETNGLVRVQADVLPGIDFEDINVAVEDNVLSVNVQHLLRTEESGEHHTHVEWHWGSVTRSEPLPAEANPQEMTTDYADGELTVTLPKDE